MSVLTEVVLRPPKEAFDPLAYRARYGADRYTRAQILRTNGKVLGSGAIHLDATASNMTMTGSLRTRLSTRYGAAVVSQRFDGRDGKPVIIYPIRRAWSGNGYRFVCKCPDYLINVLNNRDHKCKHILALEQHINREPVRHSNTLEGLRIESRDMFFLDENVYDSPAERYYQLRRRRIRDYRANQQRRFQGRRERRLAQLNQIPPRSPIELPWIDERASSLGLVEPTTLSQGEQNYTRLLGFSVARTVDTSRVESDNWHDYTEVEEQEGYAQRQRYRGERISRFQFQVERYGYRISELNRYGIPRPRRLRTHYRSFQRRTPSPPPTLIPSTPPTLTPSPPRILTPTLPSQMPFEQSPDQPPSQLSPDQPPSQLSPVSIPTPTVPFYDPSETIETLEDEEIEPFSNRRKRGRTSDIQSAPKRQAREPFI